MTILFLYVVMMVATYFIIKYLFGRYGEGSYFTDYDYHYDTTLTQVEEKEVVVKKWLPIKSDS